MSDTRVEFTEDVLRACRRLGHVRFVLRNAVGFAEILGNIEHLEVVDGWAHWCQSNIHAHVCCHAIAGVRFLDPGTTCTHQTHSTVCFDDSRGRPHLMVILDQTQGVDAIEQEHRFEDLRDRFGTSRPLISLETVGANVTAH